MSDTTLPIVVANPPEQGATIEDINTLPELLQVLAKYLAANAGSVQGMIDDIPFKVVDSSSGTASCCDAVLFVKGPPCHISFGGCDFYQYPPNAPVLIEGSVPTSLEALTEEEVTKYNLPKQVNSGATWAILRV